MKTEWSLVLFTLIAALLTAWSAAYIQNSARFNSLLFFAAGIGALGITTFHLGKKSRAHRAITNWRNSWLSREIILMIIFLSFSGLNLSLPYSIRPVGWVTIFSGIVLLFAIDTVYGATKTAKLYSHSAQVLFSGLLFYGMFSKNSVLFIGIILLKLFFYLERKIRFKIQKNTTRPALSVARLIIGFVIPLVLFKSDTTNFFTIIFLSVLSAEIIDRCEYYLELDIPTPRGQIISDLKKEIKKCKLQK